MSLFGRSKSGLLEQLKTKYALRQAAPPPDSALTGDWWEGAVDGRTIAFQAQGRETVLYAGEVVEVTEIYLVRIGADAAAVPPEARRSPRGFLSVRIPAGRSTIRNCACPPCATGSPACPMRCGS